LRNPVKATAVCIPIYISKILAAVYIPPGPAWIDADIIEVSSRKYKPVLAGDLNVKTRIWNSAVSEPSDEKFFYLAKIISKIQRHNIPLINLLRKMVTYSILRSIRISDYHM
jgi:hypothetical protein